MTVICPTNLNLVTQFERELQNYEESIGDINSTLQNQADLLKLALVTLLTANATDTHPLMRKLVERMAIGRREAYKETVVIGLAAETVDEKAKQYILNIVYVLAIYLTGGDIDLTDEWFCLIDKNSQVKSFIQNLESIDLIQFENIKNLPKLTVTMSSEDPLYSPPLGYSLYTVKLTAPNIQTLSFGKSLGRRDEIQVTEVIVDPVINEFILHESIKLSANARHQIIMLKLAPQGIIVGNPLLLTTPGLFTPMWLSVISFDWGESWTVTGVEMMPPCIIRDKP